ncbi:MAG: tRNA threonylcarbamoyladenosine dehydratase [Firmicutes bacterium]|nr:tRNA threonylcarbamoyladenosine dehydratase [Bacillota bacterium]
MYKRIINLIGEESFTKIKNTKILLVGVGGVGGFAYEALIRSGFQNITIIDKDKVEITNLNRQLVATLDTLDKAKVIVAKDKALRINENIKITAIEAFLDENNIKTLEKDFDYIIDACDTLNAKLELIKFASINNIKIISSMGVGNRLDANLIKITRLDKTCNDPLAKRLRKLVKENNLNNKIPVVCSEELPYKKGEVNSMITSPGIAGLLMVNYIINDIIKPY